jgi:hypothetical protein
VEHVEALRQLKAFFGDVAQPGRCDRCCEEGPVIFFADVPDLARRLLPGSPLPDAVSDAGENLCYGCFLMAYAP